MNINTVPHSLVQPQNITQNLKTSANKWVERTVDNLEKNKQIDLENKIEDILKSRLTIIPTPVFPVNVPDQTNPSIELQPNIAPTLPARGINTNLEGKRIQLNRLKDEFKQSKEKFDKTVARYQRESAAMQAWQPSYRDSTVFSNEQTLKELSNQIDVQISQLNQAERRLNETPVLTRTSIQTNQDLLQRLAIQKKKYYDRIRQKVNELENQAQYVLKDAVLAKNDLAKEEALSDLLHSELEGKKAIQHELEDGLKNIKSEMTVVTKKNNAYSRQIKKYSDHIAKIQKWGKEINGAEATFNSHLKTQVDSEINSLRHVKNDIVEERNRSNQERIKAQKESEEQKQKQESNSKRSHTQSTQESVDKVFESGARYVIRNQSEEPLYSPELKNLIISDKLKYAMTWVPKNEISNGYWYLHYDSSNQTYKIQNTDGYYLYNSNSHYPLSVKTSSDSFTSWKIVGPNDDNVYHIMDGGGYLASHGSKGIPWYQPSQGFGNHVLPSSSGLNDDSERRPVVMSRTPHCWSIQKG